MIQDFHKKTTENSEVLFDHGFVEHENGVINDETLHSLQHDVVPRSKHVILYKVVCKTFKQLVSACILEKYGFTTEFTDVYQNTRTSL